MAQTPNALDYLSKATNTPKIDINKPNLFDFSNVQSTQNQVQQKQPVQTTGFLSELDYDIKNGATADEISQAYPELKNNTKLINELHYDISKWATLDQVKQAYPELWQEEQWFIAWAFEKWTEAFKWGIERIWEAWVGIAEWKYDIAEWLARWGAWALQSVFAPVTWVLWESIESWIEALPQDFKNFVATKTKPTIENVVSWYTEQSPEQRRQLDNVWVWLEVLLSFAWVKWFQKAAPVIKDTTKKTWQQIIQQTQKLIKPTQKAIKQTKQVIKKPFQKPTTKAPTFREKQVGLTEKDIKALTKTDKPTFTRYVKEAKESLVDDYKQTPYHKWAKKAEDAFKKLETNLNSSYQKKAKILRTSKVRLDNKIVKSEIDDFLQTKLNVKVIDWPDGKTFTELKWRWAQIDITNAWDLQAYQQLQKVLNSKNPLEYADRLQAMQGWIYENSKIGISGWVSKKMKAFITQATWKANKNLKSQIPTRYSKIMDEMVWDINLSDDLKRVFRVDWTSNRWELAMKRLVAWTTTSWDARKLAIAIKERTWIDLIKEARLRQLTMEMVWDIRWETLFWLIEKHWVLWAWIWKGKQLLKATVLDPEKAALKRVWPTKVKPRKVVRKPKK